MNRPIALCSIMLVTLAAACKDKGAAADSAKAAADTAKTAVQAAASTPTPPPGPTVAIVSPAENDSTGSDVKVVLSGKNVTIAKADSKRVEGTGHYHLYLDTIPAMDTTAIPPTTKTVVHIGTGDSTFTFKGLKPGPHTIYAVIGYGNHVPMATQTTDTVHFIVKAAAGKKK